MTRPHVLVDMDGVIADWSKAYDQHLDLHYPHLPIPRTVDQKAFDLMAGLDLESQMAITDLMNHPGFYANLEPIPGAIEALNDMVERGYNVSIVTSPWVTNPTCASDKLNWLEEHMGHGWAKRAVITSDKTMVIGHFLIDDKPQVTGMYAPKWEHIIFSAPYNADQNDHRARLDRWEDWRLILEGANA